MSGDYHSFVLFADEDSHLPRIVNLSDISFTSPKPAGDNRVQVNVTCSATTYRFLEQAQQAQQEAGGAGKGKAK